MRGMFNLSLIREDDKVGNCVGNPVGFAPPSPSSKTLPFGLSLSKPCLFVRAKKNRTALRQAQGERVMVTTPWFLLDSQPSPSLKTPQISAQACPEPVEGLIVVYKKIQPKKLAENDAHSQGELPMSVRRSPWAKVVRSKADRANPTLQHKIKSDEYWLDYSENSVL